MDAYRSAKGAEGDRRGEKNKRAVLDLNYICLSIIGGAGLCPQEKTGVLPLLTLIIFFKVL